MFPPMMRDALMPLLAADAAEDWERARVNVRLWTLASEAEVPKLTPRERAMLRQIDEGDRSYSEIAASEHISVNTVKYHMKALYKKLGASTRAGAVASARRWGLLDDPPSREDPGGASGGIPSSP